VLLDVELNGRFLGRILIRLEEDLLAVEADPGTPLLAVLADPVVAALVEAVGLDVDGAVSGCVQWDVVSRRGS